MTSTTPKSAFADDELVQMLGSNPALLAIADALIATTEPVELISQAPSATRSRGWLGKRLLPAVAALAVVAGASTLVTLPWEGAPSLADRALAAVGTRPVLHIQLEQTTETPQTQIDLRDGSPILRRAQTEIWFDRSSNSKKTVVKLDGVVLDEFLETSKGSWTQGGPVYTCAWIKAHPADAAKAGVSCGASGGGAGASEQPRLDPVLSNFVDRYQAALASGAAREAGRGQLGGRDVAWLLVPGPSHADRVAIDAATFKPVAIKTLGGTYNVSLAETVGYTQERFTRPEQAQPQGAGYGAVTSEADIRAEEAAAELGSSALWLGAEWEGLDLVSIKRQQRMSIDANPGTAREISTYVVTYAPRTADGAPDMEARLDIYESTAASTTSVGPVRRATRPPVTLSAFPSAAMVGSAYFAATASTCRSGR